MALRFGFIALLVLLYLAGVQMAAVGTPPWAIAALMGVVFVALVAAMYLRVLPALLALPVLAVALAAVAGMKWDIIFTTVIGEGSTRLSAAILAAIMGSILAQVVEKTGIAQTAIKKTAELGGDRPMVLAVLLTIVIALLFTTLGGLGAVIMVATIVIPIMLSLGLRPLYVGCIFLLAMSLGGAFNLTNWALYKDTLGMTSAQIGAFALPFAGLMLIFTFAFLAIEGKRMGKALYKAEVTDDTSHPFVPCYALLTPVIPLLPVLFFVLLPKLYQQPAEITVNDTTGQTIPTLMIRSIDQPEKVRFYTPGEALQLPNGKYEVSSSLHMTTESIEANSAMIEVAPWTKIVIDAGANPDTGKYRVAATVTPTTYDFPIVVALLLGIIYGAITTYRRGQSTVQLLTKSAFDGVGAVGPALVLMIGIGMVLKATMAPEVSAIIGPVMAAVVPKATGAGGIVHYILLFGLLAPLALYRGPFNLWGMGAGLLGVLSKLMPGGAIMGAFMSTGMIQGVCDPTNTHNVWIANYTGTDVQDILKRTLPYMWALAFVGLLLSAVLYYGMMK